ncbi:peptide chain release factor N(5)-glutamine methyltransferase [Streptococcus sp. X16XC17]|uniref:peptide chain release factor N(5)-glutamine methyltransferase n=1 Tax=unclassified Streptococcus TaxID=2608887 RepID=UPI00066FB6A2|nr:MULTISPECIES: peptide chain release factor N(5)-glutamine methyltransferase [unclassified Streptococcus]TCD46351.1 peptide chain release factor N(5)-glutamine methyltransferase [Streptococcus sp. X16XC17]
MTTYGQVVSELAGKLEQIGEENQALSYVFKELKGWTTTDFILHLRESISQEDFALLTQIYEQLAQYIPAQHIMGSAYFMDLKLKVNQHVLIPRPETEELVELILSENSRADLRILDMGTGSGAIAIALKQARPDWSVTAVDISQEALAIASENAAADHVDIEFILSDVYENVQENFDIIVSNPPYIAYEDVHEVGKNVYEYEPHSALFADENGLAIYRKILVGSANVLRQDGKIYFEIGYKQGQDILALANQYLPQYEARVVQDIYKKDRMVILDGNK